MRVVFVIFIFLCTGLVFSIGLAQGQNFVFDNAGVLKNTRQMENEIKELVDKDGVIIIIETENFREERGRVVRNTFLKHGLEKSGRPEFNMLLVLNVGNNELYYRVSKRCELQEDEITIALNTPGIISEKDYDKMLLQAVKNIKTTIRKKLASTICEIKKKACVIVTEEIRAIERPMRYTNRGKITPTAIVLHYIDFPTAEAAITNLEALDLSVHAIVDKDGTVYKLMHFDDMAAGAKCANANSISIEILGNEKSLLENGVQYDSVVKTVMWLAEKYDIDLSKKTAARPQKGLLGHSEVAVLCPNSEKKSDPGERYMQRIRADACKTPAVATAEPGIEFVGFNLFE